MVHAIYKSSNGRTIAINTDLKTKRGYIKRGEQLKGKGEFYDLAEVEFWHTSDNNPRPYYNPSAKPDSIHTF